MDDKLFLYGNEGYIIQGSLIVFKVPIENNRIVYMKVRRIHELDNIKRAIVFVSAEKFIDSWRTGLESYNKGCIKIIDTHDMLYKYSKHSSLVTNYFKKGESDPVPLAEVSFAFYQECPECNCRHVRFDDGQMRTIWLFKNGCKEFPVECPLDKGAKELYEAVGAKGTSLKTVADIVQSNNNAKFH